MEHRFIYPSRGPGRPQILLIGNGLEYKSGQESWEELLAHLTVPGAYQLTPDQKKQVPFPLLYHLLSIAHPGPAHLESDMTKKEIARLKLALDKLIHSSNLILDQLPLLEADHIMTTNYSYCLEQAFFPGRSFTESPVRKAVRTYLGGSSPNKERVYRLQSCFCAKAAETAVKRDTGLWHIHGEACAPSGVILGYDRYCRLLQRMETIFRGQRYNGKPGKVFQKEYTSWPELFLYGDVYILGLGMEFNEFDLWWLLQRKQRERYSDGRTYFYERSPEDGFQSSKHLMMQANGVILCDAGCTEETTHDAFYEAALKDIRDRIAKSRQA